MRRDRSATHTTIARSRTHGPSACGLRIESTTEPRGSAGARARETASSTVRATLEPHPERLVLGPESCPLPRCVKPGQPCVRVGPVEKLRRIKRLRFTSARPGPGPDHSTSRSRIAQPRAARPHADEERQSFGARPTAATARVSMTESARGRRSRLRDDHALIAMEPTN